MWTGILVALVVLMCALSAAMGYIAASFVHRRAAIAAFLLLTIALPAHFSTQWIGLGVIGIIATFAFIGATWHEHLRTMEHT